MPTATRTTRSSSGCAATSRSCRSSPTTSRPISRRSWRRRPRRRPAATRTRASLADDLRDFIAGKLVSARSYSRGQLLARWLRRNRLLVGALAVVLVIAGVAARSIVHERNLAVGEREAAEARARDLVLLQARASLRSDPTATIAWLKQYPADAPHQDEVLAIADEAAGRGVARHVWRGTSHTANVAFTRTALVAANRDGTLVQQDLATGARRTIGTADKPLRYVLATPGAVFALDQDGGIYRAAGDGALERRQTVPTPSRATGFYFVPATNQLKVTFLDDEATLIAADTLAAAVPIELPDGFRGNTYDDDENNAHAWFIVQPDGRLYYYDGSPHLLATFVPHTWVRSSEAATAYAAMVPGPKGRGDRITVWVGQATAGEPAEVGAMRACAPGDDRDELAEISDDGRVTVIKRCGTMVVFVAGAEPREIDGAEHIGTFGLSRDGRWLALGRSGGLELVDLVTGASRDLAGGATVTLGEIGDGWIATAGGAQGTRVWPLAASTSTGKLGELDAPTQLVARAGELAILRHLQCERWSLADRKVTASFGITSADARDVDDERLLWPDDMSADGHACVFAGDDGSAIVVRDDGTKRTLAAPPKHDLDGCVLSGDGARVTCTTSEPAIVTFGATTERRAITGGKLRGLASYHGQAIALVDRASGCTLETDTTLATLPGGGDCRRIHASGPLGAETAVVIERSSAVDVWTGDTVLTVPTESGRVEVSRSLVAVPHEQAIEIWDLATRARRTGPPPHTHAIEHVAWSPAGVLATADDEIVQLWDPATNLVRVIYAPHTVSIAWANDHLVTTDGRVVSDWPVDLARGATPDEVRARLDALTTARIIDGLVSTP